MTNCHKFLKIQARHKKQKYIQKSMRMTNGQQFKKLTVNNVFIQNYLVRNADNSFNESFFNTIGVDFQIKTI